MKDKGIYILFESGDCEVYSEVPNKTLDPDIHRAGYLKNEDIPEALSIAASMLWYRPEAKKFFELMGISRFSPTDGYETASK